MVWKRSGRIGSFVGHKKEIRRASVGHRRLLERCESRVHYKQVVLFVFGFKHFSIGTIEGLWHPFPETTLF